MLKTNKDGYITGISQNNDGTFTAITRVDSKDFKTLKGAEKWIAKRGYNADGSKDYK